MSSSLLLLAGLCAASLVLGGVSRARADEPEQAPHAAAERWLPGIAVNSTGFFQERSGSVDSFDVDDMGNRTPLRGKFGGDSNAVFWSMGLDAELMSPATTVIPGAPRLFVHGGAVLSFDNEDPVANDDDPGKPEVKSLPPSGIKPLSGVTGTGSATRIETRPLIWSAGLGVAFETRLGELPLRIKPSVEWQFQRDRIRASLGHAEVEGITPDRCTPCRLLFIDSTTTEDYHSIGPGLELEIDAARLSEDLVLTVFTTTQALAVIGSREARFSKSAVWMTDGVPSTVRVPPTSTVQSDYKRDRWNFRAGVGIRVRWYPEPDPL